jgi:TatD DNase family protein
MNYLIDTHCHINDLSEEDLSALLERAKAVNVRKMICIGASKGTSSSFEAVSISEKYPEVYATTGIHPHDADEHFWNDELAELLNHTKVVAIGETGLDFFKEWSDFKKQEALFRNTISLAKEFKKPLVIHCRDAFPECVKILKELNAEETGGVFHCFSGTAEEAKILADMNFLVSYTGIITFKNAHTIRKEASGIPLSQIMLETDCPYMAPEPYRGKPSEPAHIIHIAETLSDTHQISPDEVAEITTKNAIRLFHGIS